MSDVAEEIKKLGSEINQRIEKAASKEEVERIKSEYKSDMDKLREKAQEQADQIKALSEQADKLETANKRLGQDQQKQKSFEQQLSESLAAKQQDLQALKAKEMKGNVNLSIKAAATMTRGNVTPAVATAAPYMLTDLESGITRVVRRQPFLRQLVTVRPINTMYAAWAEQANPDPGAAGMTAEGTSKTQTDFDIVESTAKVEKITAFIKVSKEALDDIPFLQSEINTELLELLNLKLDEQILSGNGTSPNLKGLTATGYAQAFSVASTPLALGVDNANHFDVVRAVAWQIQSQNFIPDYILVNPIDAARMDLYKGTDGHYVMPPFITASGQQVAGLTVIINNGVTADNFVAGDFRKSNLGIREEVAVSIGYDQDDFTKNLVTVLAEMRAVHYVKTNHVKAFVKGTFAAAKAALETA